MASVAVALISVLGVACSDTAPSHLSFVEVQMDGDGGVDGLDGVVSVAISPDGKNLYAAGRADDAVAVFSRDSTTGSLSFVEVHKDGVSGVDGLDEAISIAISPDGKSLYAASRADDAVAVFNRYPTIGGVTFVEVHREGVGGVDGLHDAVSLAISPDGQSLYAAGQLDDVVAVFARDPTAGSLTFVEIQRYGVGGVDGLNGATAVTVSPDGKHVYAAGGSDKVRSSAESHLGSSSLERPDAVAVFSRDSTSGALTFVEVQRDGVGGVDGLFLVKSLAVSPDGKNLYAVGGGDDAVAAFARDPTTGALTFLEKKAGRRRRRRRTGRRDLGSSKPGRQFCVRRGCARRRGGRVQRGNPHPRARRFRVGPGGHGGSGTSATVAYRRPPSAILAPVSDPCSLVGDGQHHRIP